MVEILVVDDEAAIADLVEVCLKNEGYTVYKCGSGEAALTCVARQHLDLAILDVMLLTWTALPCARRSGRNTSFPSSCSPPGWRTWTRSWA